MLGQKALDPFDRAKDEVVRGEIPGAGSENGNGAAVKVDRGDDDEASGGAVEEELVGIIFRFRLARCSGVEGVGVVPGMADGEDAVDEVGGKGNVDDLEGLKHRPLADGKHGINGGDVGSNNFEKFNVPKSDLKTRRCEQGREITISGGWWRCSPGIRRWCRDALAGKGWGGVGISPAR